MGREAMRAVYPCARITSEFVERRARRKERRWIE
jgi:hypothetical protein